MTGAECGFEVYAIFVAALFCSWLIFERQ